MDDTKVCMTEGIFRQEAIEHRRHKFCGHGLFPFKFTQALITAIFLLRFVVVESTTVGIDGQAL